jgi:hypothetical protein
VSIQELAFQLVPLAWLQMVADGEERLFVSIVGNTPKSVGHQVEQVHILMGH